MARSSLEERVATLEKLLGTLLADRHQAEQAKDWRRTRGAFTGDEVIKQIFEEGRLIREAERKRAQLRRGNKRQTQP